MTRARRKEVTHVKRRPGCTRFSLFFGCYKIPTQKLALWFLLSNPLHRFDLAGFHKRAKESVAKPRDFVETSSCRLSVGGDNPQHRDIEARSIQRLEISHEVFPSLVVIVRQRPSQRARELQDPSAFSLLRHARRSRRGP